MQPREPSRPPAAPRSGLVALLDRLAHRHLGELADEEQRRWARVVLLGGFLFLLFGLAWAASFLAYGQVLVAAIMAGGALVLPAIILTARSPAGLRLGIQLWLLTLLLSVSLANGLAGGLAGSNVATFVAIPLAALLLSARAAWVWGLLTAAVMTGFQVAHLRGYEFAMVIPSEYQAFDQTWTWAAVMMFVTGWSFFYERERLRATLELHQAKERAEQASQARGEFLAHVSHEVRTPLHAVLGALEMAAREPALAPAARGHLELARDSALGVVRVIDDILDDARLEAGKFDLRPADFELRPALEAVLRPLALLAHRKGLTFTWSAAPDVPARVRGDAARLQQVLLNLAGNAVKFTEQGGVQVELDLVEPPGACVRLRFRIQDSGVGIPAEHLASVFVPFEQAGAASAQRPPGSGLGLSIASRLIDQMGGRLELHSHEGRGTTLVFDLRLAPAAGAEITPPVSCLRVLLAEDDRVSQQVTARMLERLGHRVRAVGDGQAALEALSAEPYDLMLLDVEMPTLGGLETIRRHRLREQALGFHLPVIALTGRGLEDDRQRCLSAGMDGYLAKPVDLAALQTEIERVARASARAC